MCQQLQPTLLHHQLLHGRLRHPLLQFLQFTGQYIHLSQQKGGYSRRGLQACMGDQIDNGIVPLMTDTGQDGQGKLSTMGG